MAHPLLPGVAAGSLYCRADGNVTVVMCAGGGFRTRDLQIMSLAFFLENR